MAIKDPQRDLPAGLRGGSDTWDQPQASAVLASDFFAAPPPAGNVFNVSTTDSARGQDTAAAAAALQGVAADSARGQDQSSTRATLNAAAQDAAAGSEVVLSSTAFVVRVDEASLAAEVLFAQTTVFLAVSEVASAADEIVDDTQPRLAIWGTGSWGQSGWGCTVYDAVAVENAQGAQDDRVAPSSFSGALSDVLRAAETLTVAPSTLRPSVSETGTARDVLTAQLLAAVQVAISARGIDFDDARATVFLQIAETARGADATDVDRPANIYEVTVLEAATVEAAPRLTYTISVSIQTGAQSADRPLFAFLWNPVPDVGGRPWSPVDPAQVPGWTPVNDNQTTNWQNVANAQTPG